MAELDILWLMYAGITLRFFLEKVAVDHMEIMP